MSLYRKTPQGEVKRISGQVIQRWNDRIFLTSHTVIGSEDFYDLEPSAAKYILSFTNYTEYQLYISEPNATENVFIRFKGQALELKRSTLESIVPGSLFGKVHCYTLDVSVGDVWTDGTIEIQLIQSDISDLKAKTTSIYTYKGSRDFQHLPIDGNEVGDTYNVTDDFTFNGQKYLAGTNVAWTGSTWDPLASKIPGASKISYVGRVDANNVQTAIDELHGETILNSIATSVVHELYKGQDVTYTNALVELNVIIPPASHGYYSGINFKTSTTEFGINITNDSGKPLLIIDGGVLVPFIIFSPNKTYNLSFYCDGMNVYCYYIYVGA